MSKTTGLQTHKPLLSPTASAILSLAVLAASMVTLGRYVTTWDMGQFFGPTDAILSGNLGGVYIEGTTATSPPMWQLVAALPYALFRLWLPQESAWPAVGILTLPLLFFAVHRAVRVFHPGSSIQSAWGYATASILLPTTLAAFFEFYHPQDILASAALLLALTFLPAKRWLPAAALFSFAFLTRQWVILPVIVVFPFLGKNCWKFAGAFIGFTLAVLAPFFFIGNPGFVDAMTAPNVGYRAQTPVGLVVLSFAEQPSGLLSSLVRALPVVAAVAVMLTTIIKKAATTENLLPILVVTLALRTLFESVPYAYYFAPTLVLLILVTTRSRVPLVVGFVTGAVVLGMSLSKVTPSLAVGLWFAVFAAVTLTAWSFKTVEEGSEDAPVRHEKVNRKTLVAVIAVTACIYVLASPFFNPDPGDVDPTREMGNATLFQLGVDEITVNP